MIFGATFLELFGQLTSVMVPPVELFQLLAEEERASVVQRGEDLEYISATQILPLRRRSTRLSRT